MIILHIYNKIYVGDDHLDVYTVLYSIGMAIWSTVYLEFWKRKNSILAFDWSVDRLAEKER